MLLMALLCQVVFEPSVRSPSLVDGAIIVGDPVAEKRLDAHPNWEILCALPAARVDGAVVTVDDVLFFHQFQMRKWRYERPAESYSQIVRYMIEEELPQAIERAAVWNAVVQDFPSNKLAASWERHERAWEANRHLSKKDRENGKHPQEIALLESSKPHYIKQYVIRDYFRWKFVEEQPADAVQLAGAEKTYAKRVVAFKRAVVKRAKVETAFVISEKTSRAAKSQ